MKTCRTCRSEINQYARVCPHCRYPQGAWRFATYGLIVLVLFGFLALGRWQDSARMARILDPPKYSAHPGALKVTRSEVVYDAAAACPTVTTFGTIANQSDIAWKDLQIEVRYFDASGQMIDAEGEQAYHSFVPPNGEGVFRLQMRASREREAYSKHEVIIHYAKYGAGAW